MRLNFVDMFPYAPRPAAAAAAPRPAAPAKRPAARAPAAPQPAAAAPETVSVQIAKLCKAAGRPELVCDYLDRGLTVAQAREALAVEGWCSALAAVQRMH